MDAYVGVAVAVVVVAATAFLFLNRKPKGTRLCGVEELRPGEKKEVTVGTEKLLLLKTKKGSIHLLGNKCTHLKASMSKGVLCGDRLVCPLHAACFNVTTGDIEDGPCFDPLPVYACFTSGGAVFAKPGGPLNTAPKHVQRIMDDLRHTVIIGGGPAGLSAAHTLRELGFTGKISMLSKEAVLPYDRTKMSKNMAVGVAECLLRPAAFFERYAIDMHLGCDVTGVDLLNRTVTTAGGPVFEYHDLLIATGGPARSFVAPERFVIRGAGQRNIHVLREGKDAADITAAVAAAVGAGGSRPQVVIVGSSFIGMEAAAYLVKLKTVDVTVIGMEPEPFFRVLGQRVGAFMREMHEANGVSFRLSAVVEEFVGEGGAVTGVRLRGGEVLPANVCVVGAGIIPATGFLAGSGVPLDPADGSVVVNEYFNACANVFAAGDVARFPYAHAADGTSPMVRIEHWDVAYDQGRVAAQNIMKKRLPYRGVPFFWTQQYGKSLRSAGHANRTDFEIVTGDMTGPSPAFVVYYMQRAAGSESARVAAVVTFNRDPVAVAAMELIRLGRMPDERALLDDPAFDLEAHLAAVSA